MTGSGIRSKSNIIDNESHTTFYGMSQNGDNFILTSRSKHAYNETVVDYR